MNIDQTASDIKSKQRPPVSTDTDEFLACTIVRQRNHDILRAVFTRMAKLNSHWSDGFQALNTHSQFRILLRGLTK